MRDSRWRSPAESFGDFGVEGSEAAALETSHHVDAFEGYEESLGLSRIGCEQLHGGSRRVDPRGK